MLRLVQRNTTILVFIQPIDKAALYQFLHDTVVGNVFGFQVNTGLESHRRFDLNLYSSPPMSGTG
jgi:hypothetical protein